MRGLLIAPSADRVPSGEVPSGSDPSDAEPADAPPGAALAWDPARPYRLDPAVALRPEPFGALAYHYGSRRLTFLRSPLLVEVVRSLGDHDSAAGAVAAAVPGPKRAAYLNALESLADSKFISDRGDRC